MSRLLILFLVSFLSIDCIVEDDLNLILKVDRMAVKTVGKKGAAIILTYPDGSTQFKKTKRETCFTTKISKDYKVECGLWNGEETSSQIFFFCDIGESIPSGNYSILLNEVENFKCGDYNVTLNAKDKQNSLNFEKVDREIIDLYSEPQTIEIQNALDSYELKFNIVSYNQEKIILNFRMFLDCKVENKILKCPLTKKDLLTYVGKEGYLKRTAYLDTTNSIYAYLYMVSAINIIIKDIPKKDVSVNIKKLLVDANEHDVPIAYETDVTDVSNFYVFGNYDFRLTFINENSKGEIREKNNSCSFLKYDNNPLYLVCWANGDGKNRLKEIEKEITIKDNNIQYDYKIKPVNNEEKIQYSSPSGSFIFWYYPKVLDFTKNSGPISIYYWIEDADLLTGFTYNENEKDLTCQSVERSLKKCEITKEHFKGKKSGAYFLKHTNHLEKKSISYEVPPIKVIVDESASRGNIIESSIFYYLLLLLIMM